MIFGKMYPRLSTEDIIEEVCFEIFVNSGSSGLPDFEQLMYSKTHNSKFRHFQ